MPTVQGLLDEISGLLAAPATLESPEFELIASGVHDAAHGASRDLDPVRMRSILGRSSTPETRAWFESWGIATAKAPVRTPADEGLGIAPRLCLPVRHAGRLLGYVWLLDDGHLDPEAPATREAVRLVDQLALVLAADDPGAALAAAVHGAAPLELAALMPARVVVGQVRAGQSVLSTEVDGRPTHLVGGYGTVRGGPAGVGSLALAPADIARSYAEAAFACEVVSAVPGIGPLAHWEDLGAYRLLRDVAAPDPVLDGLDETPELLETLGIFLDHAGNVAQSAAELHIHRQTLYYRLSRIEQITGCDLGDGQARLLLHMSVKLARLGR